MIRQTGTALVTGASMGIGSELAKCFAEDGHSLILVARSESQLHRLASDLQEKHQIRATVIVKDLASPNAAQELFDEVNQKNLTVDFLVNNAGIGAYGPFLETDWNRDHQMLELNVATLTHLTKLFLPEMVSRKSGRILNVASTAAFQPGPFMAVYYASKAYVLHFSEAIANELKGSGVSVTALCPGTTQTGFFESAQMSKSHLLKRPDIMNPSTVARAGYKGMMNGRVLVVPGIINKLLVFSVRLAPRNVVTAIARRITE